MNYDIAIVGGGPGGYTAAEEAAARGCSVVLFERDLVGGTCLNRGCIPTKALLHDSAPGADFAAIHARKQAVVTQLRTGIEKLLKQRKVTIVRGTATIAAPGVVECDGQAYEARDIVIATGSVPATIPVPGIDLPGVYTSNDLLEGEGISLSSLVIVGGGVIGVEFATMYAQLGARVTVLEATQRILPLLDREIAQRVTMHLKKRGVAVEASARVTGIEGEPGSMRVCYTDKRGNEKVAEAEGVLVACGRRANIEGLFSLEVTPELSRGALVCDEVGRTSVEHLWAIGDVVAGNIQLAHVAEAQARNVIATICGEEPPMDMRTVPSCVYTSPEVASVGLTEDEAKVEGVAVRTGKALTGANGKCLVEESESGYVKLVASAETSAILGAQLVCPRATDLVAELALAISLGCTAAQLARVIHPHPTVSELVSSAARALLR